MSNRRKAVEIKPSQILKVPGFRSNGYIIEGEPNVFCFGEGETFDVTRNDFKVAYLKLFEDETKTPIGDMEPRPSHKNGWRRDGKVWRYSG